MIGFFLSAGDEQVSDMFVPYIWKDNGIDTLLKEKFEGKDYGSDLNLLLIKFYVEGKFEVYGPETPKCGNYSLKNKDIAVEITVKRNEFHDRSEIEQKSFIVNSILNGIKLVQSKLEKKKLNIDFDQLLEDVNNVGEEYLKL